MNVSTDLISATITEQPSRPPRPEPETSVPPPHTTAIESLGSSLSENTRDSIFTAAQELQQSGADFEEVKAFVNSELEANGVEIPDGGQRSGQLVDLFS